MLITQEQIKRIHEGSLIIKNNGTTKQLREVLAVTFPDYKIRANGAAPYYETVNAKGSMRWSGVDVRETDKIKVLKVTSLFSRILMMGDVIEIGGFTYKIEQSVSCNFYAESECLINDKVFKHHGINSIEIQKETLGYIDVIGSFPQCKTLADLTEYIKAINLAVENKTKEIIGYRVPCDVTGFIKKGGLMVQSPILKKSTYILHNGDVNNSLFFLKADLVEQWEPVYAEKIEKVTMKQVCEKFGHKVEIVK